MLTFKVVLPKTLTLGKHEYTIHSKPLKGKLGRIEYNTKRILVSTHREFGGRIKPRDRYDTFWHEVTHGVLHTMRHPLRDDETFVDEFGKTLSRAIQSATF